MLGANASSAHIFQPTIKYLSNVVKSENESVHLTSICRQLPCTCNVVIRNYQTIKIHSTKLPPHRFKNRTRCVWCRQPSDCCRLKRQKKTLSNFKHNFTRSIVNIPYPWCVCLKWKWQLRRCLIPSINRWNEKIYSFSLNLKLKHRLDEPYSMQHMHNDDGCWQRLHHECSEQWTSSEWVSALDNHVRHSAVGARLCHGKCITCCMRHLIVYL